VEADMGSDTETIAAWAPVPRPGGAAAPFYVTGEENLRVIVRTALAVTITVEYRLLDPCGTIVPCAQTIPITTIDRSAVINNFRLGNGWLLDLTARVTVGTPQIGQTFVTVRVVRGDSPIAVAVGTIVQGYVSEVDDLAFPGSLIRSSIEGPGFLRSLTSADPVAGSEIGITVPARTRWRLQTITFVLVTSAVAGNREVNLNILDLTGTVARVPSGTFQVISTTVGYSFFLGGVRGVGAAANWIINPMPAIVVAAGWGINSFTSGLDAGDNYGPAELVIEEWIEE
jgi:hypothetical protein